jgi:hypothetical protein
MTNAKIVWLVSSICAVLFLRSFHTAFQLDRFIHSPYFF